MAKTLSSAFSQFHKRLTPTATQSEAAKRHRKSIQICLSNNFGLTNFFRSGSFGNGTSINGYSDVDYFAVIPGRYLSRDSSYSLKKIREVLANRFPSTVVKVNTPSILCSFGSDKSEATEVVPCCEYDQNRSYTIYLIPNYSGGWLRTSPSAHNAYVRYHDQRLKSRLKPLIRFIKAWKYYNAVDIESFYLELRTTKLLEKDSYVSFPDDLASVFSWLSNKNLPAINDPMGISGSVQPCTTEVKKRNAQSKLETAATRSRKALSSIDKGKSLDAFSWYSKLFTGHFPAYY